MRGEARDEMMMRLVMRLKKDETVKPGDHLIFLPAAKR